LKVLPAVVLTAYKMTLIVIDSPSASSG